MASTAGLWTEVVAHDDHDVLALHGTLSLATVPRVRTALTKLLADRGAVVVDLAALRPGWLPALEVFPAALAAAGGWPAGRLVLTGATPELALDLLALRIPHVVPLVDDPAAAPAQVHRRPRRIVRHRDLAAHDAAPAAARGLVRETCGDWCLTAVQDVAALVATELVTNAVQHARSSCRVTLNHDDNGLRVGVRDYRPGPAPRPRPVDATRGGGRGLHLVAMLAGRWGVQRHADGKTVWALIDPMPG